MKYPLHRHVFAAIPAILAGVILGSLVIFILIITKIASIPQRVGEWVSFETWLLSLIERIADVQGMKKFRDDIFQRIRPHIKVEENQERWWILREMDRSANRTKRSIQSGEFAIATILGVSAIFIRESIYGVPVPVIFTVSAITLSLLMMTRVILMDIFLYKPELHLEEPTEDLAIKLGFNRGPFAQGSSVAIALVILLVGIGEKLGISAADSVEMGLDLLERAISIFISPSEKWRAG